MSLLNTFMKKIITGIGLFIITIINSGCPKACIEANYSFAVNAQIIPDIDSLHVGDTIFLTSTFPIRLNNLASNDTIDYSNSTNIGSTIGIVKLTNNIFPGQDAVSNFNFVNVAGTVYNDNTIPNPNKVQGLTYFENNGFYKLKIGIIPKQTGVYYLGVGNGLSNGRKNNHSCEKAGFSITLNNTNQHLNYFSDWNPNVNLSSYEQTRAYFLKVY